MKEITITQLLLLLCLLLLAIIAMALRGGSPDPSLGSPAPGPAAGEPAPLNAAKMSVYTAPALTQFREVINRPLFTESRRPPSADDTAPVAEVPEATGEPKDLTLSAVVIVGEQRTALFQKARTGETLRRAHGEEIDGWTVERISPDGVALTSNGQHFEMTLRQYPAVGQSPPPTEQAAPPSRDRPRFMPQRPPRRP
jgi:hypothetical protein